MKLLYITNGINGAGGLERVLSVKASYLAEHYIYDVTILTLNESHPNSFYTFSNKVNLRSISVAGNPIAYFGKYAKGIRQTVEQVQPDVILVCDDGLKGFFIPKILRKAKIPIIYERHVSKEIEMNVSYSVLKKTMIKAKWKLMDYLATDFSKFVVLTNGNLKEWHSLRNTTVIPNPLSFYPAESSTLNQKKVIAVGKQGYQKGYDMLLKAWAEVHNEVSDWNLEIYGKQEPSEKLNELAENLQIQNTVTFFDPVKTIQEKYLKASIYVMSSRFEGFGMVLIEAMACGVPCVSFDCNYGPSDIIANNEDGVVIANGDINQLASALKKLMTQPKLREKLGMKAKENVKRFLPENIVAQWDTLFKELTN